MKIVLGGGPAGLTAAHELSRLGHRSTVLERDEVVGGLAKTVNYKGFLFDIGGHRFYTTSPLVESIWQEILGNDFIERPRLSRIFYAGHFFQYPLEPLNVLRGLGPVEVLRCGLSYGRAKLAPVKPEPDFETWISNRFGRRLFEVFFRTYTEKVWGIPCSEIGSEWAAQRIRGLSLRSLVADALKLGERGKVRSLIKTFQYPRRGPGMMWTRMAERLEEQGSRVLVNHPVERIAWEPGRVLGVQAGGSWFEGDGFVSTLALRDLINMLDPAPPDAVREAAGMFQYRDFLTVALMIRKRDLFPDNWIYVHDPNVKVGRIQNFNNWSPEMSPDADVTCLGLEYFCFEHDQLWNSTDAALIDRASNEIEALGLAEKKDVVDAAVVRAPKAYPVYDSTYREGIERVKQFLAQVPNLQVAGRNGMHRYNNQDHAMLSGILAARNLGGGARYNLWDFASSDYLEEDAGNLAAQWAAIEQSQPLVPEKAECRRG